MNTLACFVHRILFLGAILCITASANLMLEYNWPSAPDPNINRFPHESSCHYYYLMLSEEDVTLEKCPDGQLFDYVKHNCISDREHIHCWSRHFGKMKHGHLLIKHKKHFKCPYPWGKYPHLHNCTKYHLCLNGKSMIKKCAPFELFDKISRKCIASIDAVCADKSDVVEHGYECPKTWGSFTYSKDCSKYYECLQRKPSLRTCQKGYLFDDRLAKCSSKEHVYCGVRHNPYEKFSSDAPEISSAPSKTNTQNPTSLDLDETTIVVKEKITPVKQVSLEIKSTQQETTSDFKEDTSLASETSSSFEEATLLPKSFTTSSTQVSSTQDPNAIEIPNTLMVQEVSKNEIKQENSIASEDSKIVKSKEVEVTSSASEDVSGKDEFVKVTLTTGKEPIMSSSQIAINDESEDSKKDVSTEERYTDDVSTMLVVAITQGSETTSEASGDSSSKTGCLTEESMCITEKDGTVVKCSSSKDLQPHPKDATRFLDCTGSKIKIYSCPPNLTFHPSMKKCKWQFIL